MTSARTYRSELRAQQAAETRRRILQAAREGFARTGYATTTINDIARSAGVSAQTVYAAFGAKAGLALSLIDYLNEQAGVVDLAGDIAAARSPYELLRASIHLVCVLHQRIGDVIRVLVEAAPADPTLAPAVAAGRRSHSEPQFMLAQRLFEAGALHDDIDVDVAATVLTVCTSPEEIDRYVTQHQWSHEQVEEVLVGTMVRALCKPAMARRRCLAMGGAGSGAR